MPTACFALSSVSTCPNEKQATPGNRFPEAAFFLTFLLNNLGKYFRTFQVGDDFAGIDRLPLFGADFYYAACESREDVLVFTPRS